MYLHKQLGIYSCLTNGEFWKLKHNAELWKHMAVRTKSSNRKTEMKMYYDYLNELELTIPNWLELTVTSILFHERQKK